VPSVRPSIDPDAVAAAAAAAAGVDLVDGPDLSSRELMDLARLFDRIWGRDVATMGSIVSGEILWATSHAGAQVTGARLGNDWVGGTATFLGRHDEEVVLHSHLTGVLPEHAGRGIGWALKLHQRAWGLSRGITRVVWTFDPLVRRNAVFNLVRLGSRPVGFLEDLYGPMADTRNAGLPTDRFLVHWDLEDPRVVNAVAGRGAEPRLDGLRRSGAAEILTVGPDGAPLATPTDADRLLAQIPPDIETLRRDDPEVAAAWTQAFRATVGAALDAGHWVTGITRDGWYVLARDRGVAELA
jgi:predicted GNAT superfamily acetyltransferase